MQRWTVDVGELNLGLQGNTVGGLLYVEASRGIAISDFPFHRIERHRMAVSFDNAADGSQFNASRQHAAQRLECKLTAPTLRQAQRFCRSVSCGAEHKSKRRCEIERVHSDFAVYDVFVTQIHRNSPAHASTRCRAIEIVEDQLAAGQCDMRRQANVSGTGIGWLEIQQRPEINASHCEIKVSLSFR